MMNPNVATHSETTRYVTRLSSLTHVKSVLGRIVEHLQDAELFPSVLHTVTQKLAANGIFLVETTNLFTIIYTITK